MSAVETKPKEASNNSEDPEVNEDDIAEEVENEAGQTASKKQKKKKKNKKPSKCVFDKLIINNYTNLPIRLHGKLP